MLYVVSSFFYVLLVLCTFNSRVLVWFDFVVISECAWYLFSFCALLS